MSRASLICLMEGLEIEPIPACADVRYAAPGTDVAAMLGSTRPWAVIVDGMATNAGATVRSIRAISPESEIVVVYPELKVMGSAVIPMDGFACGRASVGTHLRHLAG